MDLDWIWKSVLIVVGGTLLLRFAGRKSISQMTLTQTVIMIGMGSLLIQPLAGKNVWITLGVGGILVLTLTVMELAQIKVDFIETLITGKSKVLIENGIINEKNLKKVRLTVDQLEMNLRQKNVTKISEVKWATLEPNGQVGFVLKEEAQSVTKKEFQQLAEDVQKILTKLGEVKEMKKAPTHQQDIFSEIEKGDHEYTPPKRLQ
ncbi:DUF421 domain-containing protein [Virgibacillus sp. DJP39]|uniref:DUF421 domain-containing protein n=1 Tax=Virgibacillus sp. DJP39 TaxID=3409790 RepID=UPI003BB572D3